MESSVYKDLVLLVTGACGVTSRTIVRALRRSPEFKGIRFIGTDICENNFGLYEGLYHRIYKVSPHSAGDQYREQIINICADERVGAAIVIPEPEVLFWTEHEFPVPALLPPRLFSHIAISKERLYECLFGTRLIPRYSILSRDSIMNGVLSKEKEKLGGFPIWIRDCSEGSTSGKGAICVRRPDEAIAWMMLNPDIRQFMVSEYLPGTNLACLLLFIDGELMKIGCYERMDYFMARAVISGVSGNIREGRLINNDAAVNVSVDAVRHICRKTGETMSGLVTVDLRSDSNGEFRITEINLRQVAAASAFAEVPGANMAEAQLHATLGSMSGIGPKEVVFSPNNRLFRDIDGLPVYVGDFQELSIGEFYECVQQPAIWPESQ